MTITVTFAETESPDADEILIEASGSPDDRDNERIIKAAENWFQDLSRSRLPKHAVMRFLELSVLTKMLRDRAWQLPKIEKQVAIEALSFFVNQVELIPDEMRNKWHIDEAILAELFQKELKHQISAYTEFSTWRKGNVAGDIDKIIAKKRKELHETMFRSRRSYQPSTVIIKAKAIGDHVIEVPRVSLEIAPAIYFPWIFNSLRNDNLQTNWKNVMMLKNLTTTPTVMLGGLAILLVVGIIGKVLFGNVSFAKFGATALGVFIAAYAAAILFNGGRDSRDRVGVSIALYFSSAILYLEAVIVTVALIGS